MEQLEDIETEQQIIDNIRNEIRFKRKNARNREEREAVEAMAECLEVEGDDTP